MKLKLVVVWINWFAITIYNCGKIWANIFVPSGRSSRLIKQPHKKAIAKGKALAKQLYAISLLNKLDKNSAINTAMSAMKIALII